MIRFVYFDLGNVLVHFDHERAMRALANLASCTTSRIREVVFDSGLEDRYETGLVNSEDFVNSICDQLGCVLNDTQVLDALSDIFSTNVAMLPVLEKIKSFHLPMHILSNTCWAHWNWIERQNFPTVECWFSGRVLSYEEHSMKPDPRIYQSAFAKAAKYVAGLQPNEVLFTDDKIENIDAAKEHGWTAIHFQSAQQFLAEAEQLLND